MNPEDADLHSLECFMANLSLGCSSSDPFHVGDDTSMPKTGLVLEASSSSPGHSACASYHQSGKLASILLQDVDVEDYRFGYSRFSRFLCFQSFILDSWNFTNNNLCFVIFPFII